MNAIELLKTQHREVEQLFALCEKAEGRQKQALFDQLADLLEVHTAIEEQHFYPAVKVAATEELLEEAVDAHFEMKQILAELIDTGIGDESFDGQLRALKEAVIDHVRHEEEPILFPKVQEHFGAAMLDELGEEMTETMVTLESEGLPRKQVFQELDAPAEI
jgi:hypothetical protein